MESGFDEPAPAGTVPAPVDEPPPNRSPEAMASHQARREANRLGVELANCVATGTGGIITKDDVLRAWHAADGINAVPRIAETGTVSMAELMGAN